MLDVFVCCAHWDDEDEARVEAGNVVGAELVCAVVWELGGHVVWIWSRGCAVGGSDEGEVVVFVGAGRTKRRSC